VLRANAWFRWLYAKRYEDLGYWRMFRTHHSQSLHILCSHFLDISLWRHCCYSNFITAFGHSIRFL